MNSINEKEKKLNIALEELKNLDLTNPELQKNIENLSTKQNQLEIEKTQIEEKYKMLLEEHENLSKKLEDLKNKEKLEERKQIELSCLNFLILLIDIPLYPVRYSKEYRSIEP